MKGDLISGGNQFCRKSELFGPPFCISILKVLWIQIHLHSLDLMHSAWLRSTFLRVLKYLQIKEGGPNFWGEPILQKVWIIWSPHLYFNFKSFMDPNTSSVFRFQCILHDSGVLLSEFRNFYQLKRRGPNFWGEPILQNVWITWSTLPYFSFKSFMDPNFLSFIRFQCILPDSEDFFQRFEISAN